MAAVFCPIGKVEKLVHLLPDHSEVALLTFVGSVCPVTVAHVQAVLEARDLLCGSPPAAGLTEYHEASAAASMGRGRYTSSCSTCRATAGQKAEPPTSKDGYIFTRKPDLVVAYISANNDGYVVRKIANKVLAAERQQARNSVKGGGCKHSGSSNSSKYQPLAERVPGFFYKTERTEMMELATAEHEWIEPVQNAWVNAASLREKYGARMSITRYELDGADVALKNRTWLRASSSDNYIAIARPAALGKADGTLDLLNALVEVARRFKYDPESLKRIQMYFHVTAELAPISSSAVRQALAEGDVDSLRQWLHKDVLRWLESRHHVNLPEPATQHMVAEPEDKKVSVLVPTATGTRVNLSEREPSRSVRFALPADEPKPAPPPQKVSLPAQNRPTHTT